MLASLTPLRHSGLLQTPMRLEVGEKGRTIMGEPHLYSVDSKGEATPPPPGGPEGERPTRGQAKVRPVFAVPTDRMKFETQELALRVICTASRGGQEPVDAEKMATLMHVTPAT